MEIDSTTNTQVPTPSLPATRIPKLKKVPVLPFRVAADCSRTFVPNRLVIGKGPDRPADSKTGEANPWVEESVTSINQGTLRMTDDTESPAQRQDH